MRFSYFILSGLVATAACKKQESEPAAKAVESKQAAPTMAATATPPPAPEMKLGVTPDDKFGTSPAGLGLALASSAPDAKLTDVSGKEVSLAAMYAQGSTFVVFYRGGWCPFCNIQLHELQQAKAQFDAKGIKLVAISVDIPDQEATTQAKHGVAFAMLSDPKLIAHKAFNVVKVNTPDDIKMLAGYGIELAKFSGETHGNFAVPSMFLVDAKGVVRFAHVDTDYKTRPSPAQMLSAADKALAMK
jgi:peroxiredoxin